MPQSPLGGHYLFKNLSQDQQAWVSRLSTIQRHPSGTTLFRQGDKASAMYVVKCGVVLLNHKTKNGSAAEKVATLGPGAHFGEISLLSSEARTATALTLENVELIMLGYDKLKKLLEDQPIIGARVYKAMAQRLSGRLSAEVDDLTIVEPRLRVPA